jgi:TolB protein
MRGGVAGVGYKASLYIINAEGGEATPLVRQEPHPPSSEFIDGEPSWSPDGKQIAFLRMNRGDRPDYEEMDGDVFVVSTSGGEPKRMTFDNKHKQNLHWSPDGKYIAYDTSGEAWIVPAMGGEAKMLTSAGTGSNHSRWSPDGLSLLTVRGRSVWKIHVEGGAPTEIPLQGFNETIDDPIWSPDGKQIAFMGRVVDLGWWRVQVK